MKVVIFCGGQGMRMRDFDERVPKPLVPIGPRPVLWHVMKYYAHFGHNDFILCLGYGARQIKEYFLEYKEWLSNDFVLERGGDDVHMLSRDVQDWRITFVDTGLHSNLGQRLARVRKYVQDEESFLVNYSDGLSDLNLAAFIDESKKRDAIASFVSVRPSQSFHAVRSGEDGLVTAMEPVATSDAWVNGGFFRLRREIFDYMQEGEELVEKPFERLIAERKLWTQRHYGFWAAMDTFKDKITLDRMEAQGNCPWMVWKKP